MAEPYGVRYTIEGFLLNHDKAITLNTEDGRIFSLLMDAGEAKKFEERRVKIEGMAHRADEIDVIKVKKISAASEPDKTIAPLTPSDYQRPPSILKSDQEKIVIKDVRWDITQDPSTSTRKAKHTWENVTIRPDMIEEVYLAIKPFFPKFVAAHSLWVFKLRPGGMVSSSGKQSPGIALSIEAYRRPGQKYGLLKCFKKEFEIIWNLVTWANYATLNVKFNSSNDTALILYPVKLSRDQKVKLLRETINQACVNRSGEFYHTTRNNCTNNLIVLLNRVLPADKQFKLWTIPGVVYNLRATMPLSLVKLLSKKGYIGEPLREVNNQNFSTEFPPSR